MVNQYLKKGSNLLIEGKLRYESWEDNDGKKRSKLKVVVDQLTMLVKPQANSNESASEEASQQPASA